MQKLRYYNLEILHKIHSVTMSLVQDVEWMILSIVGRKSLVDLLSMSLVCKKWNVHINKTYSKLFDVWKTMKTRPLVLVARLFFDFMLHQYIGDDTIPRLLHWLHIRHWINVGDATDEDVYNEQMTPATKYIYYDESHYNKQHINIRGKVLITTSLRIKHERLHVYHSQHDKDMGVCSPLVQSLIDKHMGDDFSSSINNLDIDQIWLSGSTERQFSTLSPKLELLAQNYHSKLNIHPVLQAIQCWRGDQRSLKDNVHDLWLSNENHQFDAIDFYNRLLWKLTNIRNHNIMYAVTKWFRPDDIESTKLVIAMSEWQNNVIDGELLQMICNDKDVFRHPCPCENIALLPLMSFNVRVPFYDA